MQSKLRVWPLIVSAAYFCWVLFLIEEFDSPLSEEYWTFMLGIFTLPWSIFVGLVHVLYHGPVFHNYHVVFSIFGFFNAVLILLVFPPFKCPKE